MSESPPTAPQEKVTLTDTRTGKSYALPVQDGTIRAADLRQVRVSADDFGLMSYDPAFLNTASCRSRVTFIDGDKGILEYRGYGIEELAEKSTHLETAYLLLHGDLPKPAALDAWTKDVAANAPVPAFVEQLAATFPKDAHPMGMLLSMVGALGTAHPDAKHVKDPANRALQIRRLLGQVATCAAIASRHGRGLAPVAPDPSLSYPGNFLRMLFREGNAAYRPDPVVERALDVLFVLHADHEQNCSANVVRSIGSSNADPYSSVAGAIGALYGPLHGGANEEVLRMLAEIGSKGRVAAIMDEVRAGKRLLMGFGHRVYKNYDPRAKIIKGLAYQVFEVTGRNPLLDIALELEKIALEDDYFVKRRLYPNVDFYSGLIYQALGFPPGMFTVLFAVARTAGWLAQWQEMHEDPEQKIARPRQVYLGHARRPYVPVERR